jgi:hypothetical protein
VLRINHAFDAVYGDQQLGRFNAHCDEYGSQTMVVFGGEERFTTAVLRLSKWLKEIEIRATATIAVRWPRRASQRLPCKARCGATEFFDGAEAGAGANASSPVLRLASRAPIRADSSSISAAAVQNTLRMDLLSAGHGGTSHQGLESPPGGRARILHPNDGEPVPAVPARERLRQASGRSRW